MFQQLVHNLLNANSWMHISKLKKKGIFQVLIYSSVSAVSMKENLSCQRIIEIVVERCLKTTFLSVA